MPGLGATSLGNTLREERLRQKMDLAVITAQTRICPAILEAIEKDQFDLIPGGAYRRSFLRQYACALGMDSEAVVAEFKNQYEEPPLPLPVPPKRRRRRYLADVLWAFVAVASLVAVYRAMESKHAALKRREEALAQLRPTPRPTPTPTPAPAPVQSQPSQTVVASPPAPVHVAFTATEPVWVSVKCDGNVSYAGVLEGPESRTFDATGAVTALIGNAGGLAISLNGRPVGPLGAHGEVQMLELTPSGAHRISRRSGPPTNPDSVPEF